MAEVTRSHRHTRCCLAIPASVIAQEAPASQKSLAEQLVDAFNGVFGVHPGMRAEITPRAVV